MIKILFTGIFCSLCFWCSAQNQVLTYQDLQYVLQNKADLVTPFLKKKDYHLQAGLGNNETRFFALFADTDYTDLTINKSKKHTILTISTTHTQQAELVQKAVESLPVKNSKGSKIYRIKDGIIATVAIIEETQQGNLNKLYTIELEN